jgi:hypothetical protein
MIFLFEHSVLGHGVRLLPYCFFFRGIVDIKYILMVISVSDLSIVFEVGLTRVDGSQHASIPHLQPWQPDIGLFRSPEFAPGCVGSPFPTSRN